MYLQKVKNKKLFFKTIFCVLKSYTKMSRIRNSARKWNISPGHNLRKSFFKDFEDEVTFGLSSMSYISLLGIIVMQLEVWYRSYYANSD
jgi:hypothetical protein